MATLYNPLEVMRLRNDAGVKFNSIGATFGPDVRTYNDGRPKKHQGWDLYAQVGTPVFAISDGVVAWTRDEGDYGKQLLLKLNRDGSVKRKSVDGAVYAFYAHLSKILVKDPYVKGGQNIAETGTTGKGKNAPDPRYPHLHFEIRTTDRIGDPEGRLDPSVILGAQLLSCTSAEIGGVDTVQMVCRITGQPTPVSK